MVGINLDGFSLVNRLRFAKFAKLSPHQTFPLYGNSICQKIENTTTGTTLSMLKIYSRCPIRFLKVKYTYSIEYIFICPMACLP